MGFPSAATPSNVYFTPSPATSTFRTKLFGAGPGSYFDLSRFNFQVPTSGLLCACAANALTNAKTVIAANFITRMFDPPEARSFVVRLADFASFWIYLGIPVELLPRPYATSLHKSIFFLHLTRNPRALYSRTMPLK